MSLSVVREETMFSWTKAAPMALLWDMDGTLIDSEPHWWAAERELVESGGGTWSDAQALELVGSELHAAARVLQASGAPLSVDEIVAYHVPQTGRPRLTGGYRSRRIFYRGHR